MTGKKKFAVIAGCGLFVASLFGVFFFKTKVPGQSKTKVFFFGDNSETGFDVKTAIERNSQLKNNLKWTFGGKTQTGWYLYVALIQQLIDTDEKPESEQFAVALSKWQTGYRLDPNGIMDAETLYRMIEIWQSRRVNSSSYPPENELFTAPISDFYDPTRDVELLKVKKEAYFAFKKMVAAAAADKSLNLQSNTDFLKIISAFRSREYQAKLRMKSPNSGRAGLALNSPHFTGCALDIYVGGEPVTTKDENRAIQVETPIYKWLVKNAEKFGFYPYYYEPWHWEYAPKK